MPLGDAARAAEQSLVGLAVAYEKFASDLFVTYLNRDPSAMKAELENRLKQHAKIKYGQWVADKLVLQGFAHPIVADVQAIHDQKGYNITFKDAATLKTETALWLAPAHSAKFATLTVDDEWIIDAVRTIRDYVVHCSKQARTQMYAVLGRTITGGPNWGLPYTTNRPTNIGVFLRASVDARTRLRVFADRLTEIANALV